MYDAVVIIPNLDPDERLCDRLREPSGKLTELHDLIAGDVLADPTKFCTAEQFEREFDSSYSDVLAGFISERYEYLSERISKFSTDVQILALLRHAHIPCKGRPVLGFPV